MGPDGVDADVSPSLRAVLGEARSLDLLGSMELEDQIEHALGFARAFETVGAGGPDRWIDLGSGGGLPGLVLAQVWPGSEGVLLDSSHRRTEFLGGAVHTMEWDGRVRVVRARAEDAGRDPGLRQGFQAVWARSFGSPPVTAECAAPFLRVGGLLVVSEPPPDQVPGTGAGDPGGGRWPRDGLAPLGLEPLRTLRGRFGYQIVSQSEACPERFPRRAGVPTKRPLYRVVEG
jgi:16S rRNA (guanine527-N7)-methyltransferase